MSNGNNTKNTIEAFFNVIHYGLGCSKEGFFAKPRPGGGAGGSSGRVSTKNVEHPSGFQTPGLNNSALPQGFKPGSRNPPAPGHPSNKGGDPRGDSKEAKRADNPEFEAPDGQPPMRDRSDAGIPAGNRANYRGVSGVDNFALKDGADPPKKSAGKVTRETFGKAVKIGIGALLLHQMGLIDLTDPLGQVDAEEECLLDCEDNNPTDGEAYQQCAEACKDPGGDIIGAIVNVIMMIIVIVIVYYIGKSILKKKGKVGESSGGGGDDYGGDDYYYDDY